MAGNNKVDVGFIFQITDKVLWNVFKKNEIGDVLLPFVVIRRLDCILEPVNVKVREAYNKFKEKVSEEKLNPILRKAAGSLQFYNTSKHTLESLKENPKTIEIDFNNYLNGFNKEVRDIIDNFQFDKVIARLVKNKSVPAVYLLPGENSRPRKSRCRHSPHRAASERTRRAHRGENETAGPAGRAVVPRPAGVAPRP